MNNFKKVLRNFWEVYQKYFWWVIFSVIAIILLPVFFRVMKVVLPFTATIYGQGFEICSKPLASITLRLFY